jgi:hypothetical protein
MIELTKKTREEWRKSLGSEAAKAIFSFMREARNRPQFPSTTDTQPHHIQLAAGKQLGWDQCLDTLEELARTDRPGSIEDGTPTLVNTRNQ